MLDMKMKIQFEELGMIGDKRMYLKQQGSQEFVKVDIKQDILAIEQGDTNRFGVRGEIGNQKKNTNNEDKKKKIEEKKDDKKIDKYDRFDDSSINYGSTKV